tara:strand:- start:850 stop:1257 length:408 start_codon:yes stop_codon:yes gene_type:complete
MDWKEDLQYSFGDIKSIGDGWYKVINGPWKDEKIKWNTKIGQKHSADTLEWHSDNSKPKPSQADLKTRLDEILLEETWGTVRGRRNTLLNECDWCVGNDSPLTSDDKAKWVSYRQELRDVPTQSDPNNITWPAKP